MKSRLLVYVRRETTVGGLVEGLANVLSSSSAWSWQWHDCSKANRHIRSVEEQRIALSILLFQCNQGLTVTKLDKRSFGFSRRHICESP